MWRASWRPQGARGQRVRRFACPSKASSPHPRLEAVYFMHAATATARYTNHPEAPVIPMPFHPLSSRHFHKRTSPPLGFLA